MTDINGKVKFDFYQWLFVKGFYYKINDYGLVLLIKYVFLQNKVIEENGQQFLNYI